MTPVNSPVCCGVKISAALPASLVRPAGEQSVTLGHIFFSFVPFNVSNFKFVPAFLD
jgi:hypothetical protein